MPSVAKDLGVVMQAQQQRDLAPDVHSMVANEMKSSLLFQISWEELLQSAPTAIQALGAYFVASSSPKATVTLTPPAKGFQYLRYTSVQANLVECGNLGRYAFNETQVGMGTIQQASKIIENKISNLGPILSDPVSCKKLLKPQLTAIKNGADQCYDSSVKMSQKFDEWLFYVCEMHAACVAEENLGTEAMLNNQVSLAAESTRLEYQKKTVEAAENASKVMEKQVELAGKAFEKASDEFPSGWDILGQQIVGGLCDALTTGLNQALPALIDNMNPMAKAKASADLVGGFIHPPKDDKSGSAASTAPLPTVPTAQSALPPKASDPAYAKVIEIQSFLAALKVVVMGKDDNIDWQKAAGDGTNDDAKSTVQFLETMLKDHQSKFDHLATADEPSQTLKSILDTCIRVAKELNDEVKKSKGASHNTPAKDSEQVKNWMSSFQAAYDKATALAATARSLPGSTANGVPPMPGTADSASQQLSAKSAQAQAVLESAKNRLNTTSEQLTKSQENFVKSTEILVAQKQRLGEIEANLSRLTASNITLAEIKRILIECIKLVIVLKNQINNLVRFFNAIAVMIQMTVKFQVDPFLETIKSLVAADGTDPNKDLRVGNFTLTDLQRSQVFSASVVLRSYFSVFGDIGRIWIELSNNNIMPGLKLCDELSVTSMDPQEIAAKTSKLLTWSKAASAEVARVAKAKQAEILDTMESRAEEIKATTAQIEPPPESTIKAITAGTELTQNAAQKSIEQKKTSSPLFTIVDDDE